MVKNLPFKAGDPGSIPGLGRSPGEGNGNPFPFLPGESHGQRSLVGYSWWDHRVRHDWVTGTTHLYLFLYIPHLSDIIWYLSFSFWFTSLSMMIFTSIHVAVSDTISFIILLYKCPTSSLPVHLLMDTSGASMSWIVNSAAMNTRVNISFWIMIFSGYMPRNGIAGSYGNSVLEMFFKENDLCLNNLENAILYLPCLQS